MTTDMAFNLDSECILNEDVLQVNNYQKYKTFEPKKDIGVKPGKKYKVNVIAEVIQGEF